MSVRARAGVMTCEILSLSGFVGSNPTPCTIFLLASYTSPSHKRQQKEATDLLAVAVRGKGMSPIRHLSLKHGWFYHYRAYLPKIAERCKEYPQLAAFLYEMLERGTCPDECFTSGPRSSALRFPIAAQVMEVVHPITELARAGLNWGQYTTAHSNVQVFMLAHDTHSLAIEVPLWWLPEEMGVHANVIPGADTGPLSGHIDVLRVESDGKIWVWDYKPGARKEKYAATQTYYYALMLAQRTGIPLSAFRCGWFDDEAAFVFSPDVPDTATSTPTLTLQAPRTSFRGSARARG